jgi:hypothetical protein
MYFFGLVIIFLLLSIAVFGNGNRFVYFLFFLLMVSSSISLDRMVLIKRIKILFKIEIIKFS